jgi:hypothetical protein
LGAVSSSGRRLRTAQAGFKQGRAGESAADLLARVGPTILVHVGLKSMAAPGEPPDLPLEDVHALIDTGAGADGIDDDLAQQLGLPITEEGWISGVGGRHRAAIYTAPSMSPRLTACCFNVSRA